MIYTKVKLNDQVELKVEIHAGELFEISGLCNKELTTVEIQEAIPQRILSRIVTAVERNARENRKRENKLTVDDIEYYETIEEIKKTLIRALEEPKSTTGNSEHSDEIKNSFE